MTVHTVIETESRSELFQHRTDKRAGHVDPPARHAAMNTPSLIWICTEGKDLPDWIVERLVGEVNAKGEFSIETADGEVAVRRGWAVFYFNGQVFACEPKNVQAKLAAAVGADHEVIAELAAKTNSQREGKTRNQRTYRESPGAKLSGDRSINIKPMIGEPPSPQFAAVERLLVDDTYQRSIEGGSSQKLIVKIAENWDWRLCLPLLVSRRDGQMYVIDGQHRLEAARLRGDIAHMPVVVFDLDDPRAEAELFVAANRSRRAMSKLDDFHAAIVAGDPKAVVVNDAVTAAGLKVGRVQAWQYWKPGEVVFVTAVQRALHTNGKALVTRTLTIVARAFDGLVLTGVGSVFEGLLSFIREREQANQPIDDGLMEVVLAEVGIPGWKEAVDGAESGQERVERMRVAIVKAYSEAEGVE